jgi:dCTP deaminase
MRLSDVDIVRRLTHKEPAKRIVITPMISASEQIGPASVDVHLGTEFMVVEQSDRQSFDPLISMLEYQEWLKHLRVVNRYSLLDPFTLHPSQFALGITLEFMALPDDVVGRIDGRSSWARQGLVVHSTAGDIHPGSRGFVVFELMNVGPVPILLYPGLAIAQLTFEELSAPVGQSYAKRANSKYFGFRQTLWSAYPDDSVLRVMRQLKARKERNQVPSLLTETPNTTLQKGPRRFMPDQFPSKAD